MAAQRVASDDQFAAPYTWLETVTASDGRVLVGVGRSAEEAESKAAASLQKYEQFRTMTPQQKLAAFVESKDVLTAEETTEAIRIIASLLLAQRT